MTRFSKHNNRNKDQQCPSARIRAPFYPRSTQGQEPGIRLWLLQRTALAGGIARAAGAVLQRRLVAHRGMRAPPGDEHAPPMHAGHLQL